jgi:hypothetical protein
MKQYAAPHHKLILNGREIPSGTLIPVAQPILAGDDEITLLLDGREFTEPAFAFDITTTSTDFQCALESDASALASNTNEIVQAWSDQDLIRMVRWGRGSEHVPEIEASANELEKRFGAVATLNLDRVEASLQSSGTRSSWIRDRIGSKAAKLRNLH